MTTATTALRESACGGTRSDYRREADLKVRLLRASDSADAGAHLQMCPNTNQSTWMGPVGGAVRLISSASGTIATKISESTKNVSVTAIICACRCTRP